MFDILRKKKLVTENSKSFSEIPRYPPFARGLPSVTVPQLLDSQDALLLGTGLICELVIRKINKIHYRIAICAAILAGLILIWAELAVGIFGTPLSGTLTPIPGTPVAGLAGP